MRRIVDVVVALLALALLLPLLLAIALAVAISSPGGPFHRGWRVGKDGRKFRMWKFRTMVRGGARIGPPITGRNDPRITGLGRFLRKTKLDELPQFLNVLAGEMTLVGPRPEAPEIVAQYSARQRAVLLAKPGVTGMVQLNSAGEADAIPEGADGDRYYIEHLMAGKLQMDLGYLERRTALTDARILLETVALLAGRLPASALQLVWRSRWSRAAAE